MTADSIIKPMSSTDVMCAGSFKTMSQVDVVDRQQHPSLQPCTNFTAIFFGNPNCGINFDPVNHFTKLPIFNPCRPIQYK